jgi:adenylate cyclase
MHTPSQPKEAPVQRENTVRRLAAILSADVVGYSRLIGIDEAGTLAALRAHRAELIDSTIVEHNGRIVKLMGDGLLVEFASAINAVECAVAIQHGMTVRNTKVPDDRSVDFRIGINLGDVMIEGDDIYGDGVNVAARLQEIAEPGGVFVSGTIFEQVDGKVPQSFVDLGNQKIKNINKLVRVYS